MTQELLRLDVIIPTLKSSHENFKILDIVDRVIKVETTPYEALRHRVHKP